MSLKDLILDQSPTSWHAVDVVTKLLQSQGVYSLKKRRHGSWKRKNGIS